MTFSVCRVVNIIYVELMQTSELDMHNIMHEYDDIIIYMYFYM
jgi:hypothetical protein